MVLTLGPHRTTGIGEFMSSYTPFPSHFPFLSFTLLYPTNIIYSCSFSFLWLSLIIYIPSSICFCFMVLWYISLLSQNFIQFYTMCRALCCSCLSCLNYVCVVLSTRMPHSGFDLFAPSIFWLLPNGSTFFYSFILLLTLFLFFFILFISRKRVLRVCGVD